MEDFMPRDRLLATMYTRGEGERLENNKATVQVVKALESKLDQATSQIAKLAHVVEYQTTAISDLNTRLERAQRQIDDHHGRLLHPDHDELYTYVDRMGASLQRDLQQAMATMSDKFNLGIGVPEELVPEPVVRAINQMQDKVSAALDAMGADVSRRLESQSDSIDAAFQIAQDALDAQFQKSQAKLVESAGSAERAVKSLAAELAAHQSKAAAMESAVKGLDRHLESARSDIETQVESKLRHFHAECLETKATQLHAGDVRGIVEQSLRERHLGDVTQSELQRALADLHVAGRNDAAKERELLLREVQWQQAQTLRDWQLQLTSRIDSFAAAQDSCRREAEGERQRMSELAEEVSRSLSKKASQSEVRALVRGVEKRGASSGADSAVASASAEAVRELEERLLDTRSELGRANKATAEDVSKLRLLINEKLDSAKVESIIASVLEQATGRSIPRAGLDGRDMELRYNWHGTFNLPAAPSVDWKVAVGELGMSLRRELEKKLSREECRAAVLEETAGAARTLRELRQELDGKAEQGEVAKVVHSLEVLSNRVVSELTGGLWLWTSRQLASTAGDSRIPWDAQVVNSAPSSLLWRTATTEITVKLPGLYRVGLAVFTSLPVSLTVCLNGEPVLALGPDAAPDRLSSFANVQGLREERYSLRRLRHSAGDTTAVSLDEPISLPTNAVISVTYQSAVASQAYLSLRKL